MELENFSYHVFYPRTATWFNTDWREISNWCSATYGNGNWEYSNSYFLFLNGADEMLFKLRWLQ